jgi:hypothetical protein
MDYLIDIGHLFKGTCGDDFALVPSKYSTIGIPNRRLSENPKRPANLLQEGNSEVTHVKNV